MSNLLKKIEHEALSLTVQERSFFADRLLSSLDEDTLTDIDAAWIAEAERRYQEYKEGKRPGVAAQEVFSEADRTLMWFRQVEEFSKRLFMSRLMEKKWLEMIEAFLKLTPQERSAEAEKRLDETLERMSQMYNISPEEAYEKLIKNSHRMHR